MDYSDAYKGIIKHYFEIWENNCLIRKHNYEYDLSFASVIDLNESSYVFDSSILLY